LRLLVGTFVLALSVIVTGCIGSRTQEQERNEDFEKMKMLKKQEEKRQEEKEKEETKEEK
jgi:hypothetical protein